MAKHGRYRRTVLTASGERDLRYREERETCGECHGELLRYYTKAGLSRAEAERQIKVVAASMWTALAGDGDPTSEPSAA